MPKHQFPPGQQPISSERVIYVLRALYWRACKHTRACRMLIIASGRWNDVKRRWRREGCIQGKFDARESRKVIKRYDVTSAACALCVTGRSAHVKEKMIERRTATQRHTVACFCMAVFLSALLSVWWERHNYSVCIIHVIGDCQLKQFKGTLQIKNKHVQHSVGADDKKSLCSLACIRVAEIISLCFALIWYLIARTFHVLRILQNLRAPACLPWWRATQPAAEWVNLVFCWRIARVPFEHSGS